MAVTSAAAELDRVSDLCRRLGVHPWEAGPAAGLLEPVASFLGAETATFRALAVSRGDPKPSMVVSLGIPDAVNEAYFARYYRLDPARRLLFRRLTKPLFAHSAGSGEWSRERASAEMLEQYREEFRQYRREFLLPNDFYHHIGFCIQVPDGRTLLFDFHRNSRSAEFNRLEHARARIVALFLHAKTGANRRLDSLPISTGLDGRLSTREIEVAEAVSLGLSNKQIATTLDISVRTVENHMRSIFAKFRVTTRTQLAAKLYEATKKPAASAVTFG
jgi:DNA-binding CsgD family transcriptional regulator